jgi:hypothetical protein
VKKMKKILVSAMLLGCGGLLFGLSGCADDDGMSAGGSGGNGAAGAPGVGGSAGGCAPDCPSLPVSGEITSDVTWTADSTPTLETLVFVRAPATLTIEAGTVVKGKANSALVIDRGARIMAKGTAQRPIVMTSGAATRKSGDWGGLVLVGRARTNDPGGQGTAEGFAAANVYYGGNDDADSSGAVEYVRIEFAGYQVSPDNELNGLSMYSVGSGTSIHHVQVHFGLDDGFEWFGGTVNAKYLLSTGNQDDSFDMDRGWRGKAQFLVAVQDEAVKSDNGFECDNQKDDPVAEPVTSPTIYNVTLVGKKAAGSEGHGLYLRRGMAGTIANALIYGFPQPSMWVEGAATVDNAKSGKLNVIGSTFGGEVNFKADPGLDLQAWALDPSRGNRVVAPGQVSITDDRVDAPILTLQSESAAVTAGATPPDDGFFDTSATYVGACGSDCSEFEGWTAYPLQ